MDNDLMLVDEQFFPDNFESEPNLKRNGSNPSVSTGNPFNNAPL